MQRRRIGQRDRQRVKAGEEAGNDGEGIGPGLEPEEIDHAVGDDVERQQQYRRLRAEAAGAEILEGLTDRGYGSREFICRDPEGNVWSLGTYWPKSNDKPN